jgi:2-polyprenyl-3-methyl-5-hydroxy-6-metoxy-1,4-benzoquinol methylase
MTGDYRWTGAGPTKSTPYVTEMVLRELPIPPLRVLDVGCGNGITTAAVADAGYEVVGVDPSESGIEIASRLYGDRAKFHVSGADPNLLDEIDEGPFDVVLSCEVVEHVFDPHVWADACYAALRPGGMLIVTTPHHGYVKNLLLSLMNGWDRHWRALETGGHIKFWSRRTLSELLESHGFRLEQIFGIGRPWPVWASLVVIAAKI